MTKRIKRLSLRLNEEEYAQLRFLAKCSGCKLEPTIRTLISGAFLAANQEKNIAGLLRTSTKEAAIDEIGN